MLYTPACIVASVGLRPFKGICFKVEKFWEAQDDEGILPHIKSFGALFKEGELPAIVTQARKISVVGPIKILFAFARTLPRKQFALIVAVKVYFKSFARSG